MQKPTMNKKPTVSSNFKLKISKIDDNSEPDNKDVIKMYPPELEKLLNQPQNQPQKLITYAIDKLYTYIDRNSHLLDLKQITEAIQIGVHFKLTKYTWEIKENMQNTEAFTRLIELFQICWNKENRSRIRLEDRYMYCLCIKILDKLMNKLIRS